MLGYHIESRFTILKLRSFIYVVLVVLGIVWTGLLSADVFVKEGFRSNQEAVATLVLLSSQVVMAIGIPIVILLGSQDSIKSSRWFNHAWFELFCLWLMLSYQSTGALLFSLSSVAFRCQGDADEQGACQLVNAYISICSWITPIILFSYCIYTTIKCIRLSVKYPQVWSTPFTLMPWNPNLLDLAFEPKQSTSTLNKPRGGSLDEINQTVSKFSSSGPSSSSVRGSTQSSAPSSQNAASRFSSSDRSARASTQSQSSQNASRVSASAHFTVRTSTQPLSTTIPSMSRSSQILSSARSSTQFQVQRPSPQWHPQPPSAINRQSMLNHPPSSSKNVGWRQSQSKGNPRQSMLPPNPTLLTSDKRLTFQLQVPPPSSYNPPVAHTTLGPPIPLTLPSLRDKHVSSYLPMHYHYPRSSSTTRQSTQLLPPSIVAGSRVSLHPPSLYPNRNGSGMPHQNISPPFNKI